MKEFDRLIEIVAKLRHPENGCPWDLKQTSKSLVPNFIEELYEAVEAIEHDNSHSLSEELGDLLLHIAMQAKIAEEKGDFSFETILKKINEKLIRRHPHIFGEEKVGSAETVKQNWEKIKMDEKKKTRDSVLEGIPHSMPALIVAQRMQDKAASVGFDWDSPEPVIEKMREEFDEFLTAYHSADINDIEEEIGDVLFTTVNLARKLGLDSETALRRTIKKFEYRFKKIEEYHKKNNENIYDSSLEKLDAIWEEVKKQ